MRIPDFWKCPECGGEAFKYTRSKNNEAMYLCNDCGKHMKMKFAKRSILA